MAQFLRPESVKTQGNWTGTHTAIDEATFSDADFSYSQNKPSGDYLEVNLGSGDTPDPGAQTIRARAAKVNNGVLDSGGSAVNVTVGLYQGATLIASFAISALGSTFASGSHILTTGEKNLITDYSALSLRFTPDGGAGGPSARRGSAISWAEFEVPDSAGQVYTLTGTTRSISASEKNASLLRNSKITGTAQSVNASPRNASLTNRFVISATVRATEANVFDAALRKTYALIAQSRTINAAQNTANLNARYTIEAPNHSITALTQNASLFQKYSLTGLSRIVTATMNAGSLLKRSIASGSTIGLGVTTKNAVLTYNEAAMVYTLLGNNRSIGAAENSGSLFANRILSGTSTAAIATPENASLLTTHVLTSLVGEISASISNSGLNARRAIGALSRSVIANPSDAQLGSRYKISSVSSPVSVDLNNSILFKSSLLTTSSKQTNAVTRNAALTYNAGAVVYTLLGNALSLGVDGKNAGLLKTSILLASDRFVNAVPRNATLAARRTLSGELLSGGVSPNEAYLRVQYLLSSQAKSINATARDAILRYEQIYVLLGLPKSGRVNLSNAELFLRKVLVCNPAQLRLQPLTANLWFGDKPFPFEDGITIAVLASSGLTMALTNSGITRAEIE